MIEELVTQGCICLGLQHLSCFLSTFTFPSFLFLLIFWLCHRACGIIVPWLRTKPMPPVLEARSPNQWTAREVLPFFFNNLNSLQVSLTILGGSTGFPLPNEVGCFPYHVKSPTQFFFNRLSPIFQHPPFNFFQYSGHPLFWGYPDALAYDFIL